MNAVIIPCFDYNIYDSVGRMLLPYNQQKLAQYPSCVDTIIFAGNNMGFDTHTETVAGKQIRYIATQSSMFEKNVLEAINSLSSGDKFVLKDMDMLIYDYSFYTDIFTNDLQTHNVVSILDGNTHIIPTYDSIADKPAVDDPVLDLAYKIPAFAPSEAHRGYTRVAHWTFATSYDYFKSMVTDAEFVYKPMEPMEYIARNIAQRDPNVAIKVYPNYKNAPWCLTHPSTWITSVGNVNDIGFDNPYNGDNTDCTNEAFATSKYFHISSFGNVLSQIAKIQGHTTSENTPFADQNHPLILNYVCWGIVLLNKVYDPTTANSYIALLNVELNRIGIDYNDSFFQTYLQQFNTFYRTNLL
jgi:hypothetical protein